jgi:preprotein translocase subunit SecF
MGLNNMWVINNRKYLYIFTAILVVISIASLAMWGLKPGIDFAGGTLIEVSYPVSATSTPSQSAVIAAITPIDSVVSVRPSSSKEFVGSTGYIIRMKAVSQDEKASVMSALSFGTGVAPTVKSFDSIGPVLGAEALRKAVVSVILVILGIVLYITFAFRKVSEPVKSWKYGLIAIASLVHDIIIPLGAFSILGHYLGYEVDTLFVTALLVILGFSIHNTIVVFDRVRENLSHNSSATGDAFAGIVGASVNQTITRSINTSLTVLIALVALYIFGGSATEHFTLALIIGILAGTYSSVCFGSSLLVTIERKWKGK